MIHRICPHCGKKTYSRIIVSQTSTGYFCTHCGAFTEDRSWYTEVDEATMKRIIETRQPEGLFLCVSGDKITAVDNQTGDAWTEDFPNLVSAWEWLCLVEDDWDWATH